MVKRRKRMEKRPKRIRHDDFGYEESLIWKKLNSQKI